MLYFCGLVLLLLLGAYALKGSTAGSGLFVAALLSVIAGGVYGQFFEGCEEARIQAANEDAVGPWEAAFMAVFAEYSAQKAAGTCDQKCERVLELLIKQMPKGHELP